MPDNLKDKKVLVWDANGLGVEHAIRLSLDFGKIWYYCPWQTGFPVIESYALGYGMEGIEKILYFENYIDQADLIYFIDTGKGDLAHFLRGKGYRVFGGGAGERLENERFKARKLQKALGLPTQKTVEVKGTSKLKKYLKDHKDQYVKFDIFRGTLESFYSKDYDSVETLLDEIEAGFGPLKEEYSFMVEESVPDAVEVGSDTFFNGTKFIEPCLWGIESGVAYIGTYENHPSVYKKTLNKLAPVLAKANYHGAFSTEERTVRKDRSYLVDITARYPYALSLIYTESIKNYSEVVWKVAGGEDVELIPRAKYCALLPLESPHASDHWLRLCFDSKLRHKIKLQRCCKVDDYYYCVKGMPNGVLIISLGNTINKCINDIERTVNEVSAHELKKEGVDVLNKIKDQINALNAMEINF